MNKVFFYSLAVEVTRRCNMHCAHCLRGEAENKDISYEVMDALLRHVDGIAQVRLTEKDVVRHRLVQQIVRAYEQAAEARTPKTEKRAVSDDKR